MFLVLDRLPGGSARLTEVDDAGVVLGSMTLGADEVAREVDRRERVADAAAAIGAGAGAGAHTGVGADADARAGTDAGAGADAEAGADTSAGVAQSRGATSAAARPRWVWDDTSVWYGELLQRGVLVERGWDLRLCRTILRRAVSTRGSRLVASPLDAWDAPPAFVRPSRGETLFDGLLDDDAPTDSGLSALDELQRQLEALASSSEPGRLRLLLVAESTGALIAAEMRHSGVPWRADVHDRQLTDILGSRPTHNGRPEKLEHLADEIRGLLGAPQLNPDSQPELLRALRQAGLGVTSTSKWELGELKHPVIEPLLRYKKMSRLLGANGWAWMDAWVRDGRFHPDYVVGGVVTGRWATSGGGALQLPAQIRSAVQADDGWKLVVADAAQLEPRIIAAMSRDTAMADAGRERDLYQGLVDAGVVDTRPHAKLAMLGALYGATSGESARLMPRLLKAYPKATGLVEAAARAGEAGEQVSTWLGRSSPLPSDEWREVTRLIGQEGTSPADEKRARQVARDWGRFTRNFVAQGTAAEWAMCWMAGLRLRLRSLRTAEGTPQLVFFLHDEVMVHAPAAVADEVARAVRESAAEAGRLLFGGFPIDFALEVAIADNYAEAK
jgi:DNA polymerase-1